VIGSVVKEINEWEKRGMECIRGMAQEDVMNTMGWVVWIGVGCVR
jgi:hypothetical protein